MRYTYILKAVTFFQRHSIFTPGNCSHCDELFLKLPGKTAYILLNNKWTFGKFDTFYLSFNSQMASETPQERALTCLAKCFINYGCFVQSRWIIFFLKKTFHPLLVSSLMKTVYFKLNLEVITQHSDQLLLVLKSVKSFFQHHNKKLSFAFPNTKAK